MEEFKGRVEPRSTKPGAVGGASDMELILSLNEDRCRLIKEAMGWDELFPGSLNVDGVDVSVIRELLWKTPVHREDGRTVKYPEGEEWIPIERVAYRYFRGRIRRDGSDENADVLFLLAEQTSIPPRPRLEVFAPAMLKGTGKGSLGLKNGDVVICDIAEKQDLYTQIATDEE